jgi:hypothetical protein
MASPLFSMEGKIALSASSQAKGKLSNDPRLLELMPASRLQRPAVPTLWSGIAEVDEFTGGFPRGALTEIFGTASSGRSSFLLAFLAEATRRQEICALVDTSDSFDPYSAVAIGVDLERLLWVRCSKTDFETRNQNSKAFSRHSWMRLLEQALKATDLLLQGGGFGVIAVDMADVPPEFARRVPLASWFRFRRAVERTPTVLLVLEQEAYAKSCASLVLKTSSCRPEVCRTFPPAEYVPSHGQLFRGMQTELELVRQRQWSVASGQWPVRKTVQREYASRQSLAVGAGH